MASIRLSPFGFLLLSANGEATRKGLQQEIKGRRERFAYCIRRLPLVGLGPGSG